MEGMIKSIPGYEGLYDITSTGKVWNVVRQKWMSPSMTPKGYRVIGLTKGNKREYFRLCRLVAQVFLPNPENLPVVNHKDECRTNDSVYIENGQVVPERSNLEWCTVKYNTNYGSAVVNRVKARYGRGLLTPEEKAVKRRLYHRLYYLDHLEEITEKRRNYMREYRKKQKTT